MPRRKSREKSYLSVIFDGACVEGLGTRLIIITIPRSGSSSPPNILTDNSFVRNPAWWVEAHQSKMTDSLQLEFRNQILDTAVTLYVEIAKCFTGQMPRCWTILIDGQNQSLIKPRRRRLATRHGVTTKKLYTQTPLPPMASCNSGWTGPNCDQAQHVVS